MKGIFADRMQDVPRSFIREILKVTTDKSMISFAGGLPNRQYFPLDQLKESTNRVFDDRGTDCLQYSNSEGLLELRECISRRYKAEEGIEIPAERILITNGSQQALDLIAKVTINDGDPVVIEEPGYLGAIQALSLYRPHYLPVKVDDEGMDVSGLEMVINRNPKMMYTVPNFQNPSGISYSHENRCRIVEVIQDSDCLLIEDDPYGSLRFYGEPVESFHHLAPDQTILLGSFSKTVVPGFRIGWVAAPEKIYDKLLIAKQAADLHTCNFTQYVLLDFLTNNEIEEHLQKIRTAYGNQCRAMIESIEHNFPDYVTCTKPNGGMFLWGRLPDNMSSLVLFEKAVRKKVVFVPGEPFYTRETASSAFRLNFSCTDEKLIGEGIDRLAEAILSMESD
ncbi:MAG: PLP-dependent aminotransferase family protein [Desulfocapsaceae bacterium]